MFSWFSGKAQKNEMRRAEKRAMRSPLFVMAKQRLNGMAFLPIMTTILIGATVTAEACEVAVSDQQLKINNGGSSTFSVNCSSFCSATDDFIKTTPADPSKVQVTSAPTSLSDTNPNVFTIERTAPGTTSLLVEWELCPNGTPGSPQTFNLGTIAISEGVTGDETKGDLESGGEDIDPVSTFNGELFDDYAPDINLGGPMPLMFSRYYASGLKAANITGALGDNWRHNFEWSMTSTATLATITSPLGRKIAFAQFKPAPFSSSWTLLIGRTDIPYTLAQKVVSDVGKDFTLTDPRSNLTYIFNPSGQLLSITNSVGSVHTLTYNAGGQLTQVVDGLGRTLNYSYNGTGKLIGVNDGLGRNVGFSYAANDLTGVTDLLGNTTSYAYAAGGLMTGTTRPIGNTTFSQTWNANNQVVSQADALGNTATLAYATNNTDVTDALSNKMTHTHTLTGELNNVARRDGSSVSLASNADAQRSGITDALGATTGFTYHANSGRVASTTHANGATSSKSFTGRTRTSSESNVTLFDVTNINYADGTGDTLAYDAFGRLIGYTVRGNNATQYSRNSQGQWLQRANPLNGVATRTYNSDATMANSIDVSGNQTSITYDAQRRPTTITLADASTQLFTYDAMNRPLSITDNRGAVSGLAYDANGNLSSRTNRVGTATTFSYDAMDAVIKITDANTNFSTLSYDALRRLSSTTDRNGNSVTFAYDTQDRITSVTDGNGNVAMRTFDTEGIIATATTPLGNKTSYTSNNMGRITQVSSPLGNTLQIAYDVMNRPTGFTDPLGRVSSSTYDASGRLASRTLPGAISASYTRNDIGSITKITDPNANDWLRSIDTAGRVTASSDPLIRSTVFAYDNRNRISTLTFPNSAGTRTNTYDANGNQTRKLYSDGTDLNFTFDAEDRLLTANGLVLSRDNLGRITNSNGIAMAYDAGGRITSITYAAGKAVSYTYDANNNLKTVTDWLSGVSTFIYDADDRLTSMTRPNGATSSWSYDADGRLAGFVDGTLGATTLTRDANGRMTAAARSVPIAVSVDTMVNSAHSFDVAAQVSSTGFSYDDLGRQTNDGNNTYAWDLASRLTSVGTTTHTYDGIGYRLSRTTVVGTRNTVWNLALGLPSVSIEKQGTTDLRYYIHSPGGALLYSIDATGSARHFYHFDETGNTRFVSNDVGTVEASYAYSPFGLLQASTGVLDNPFTWQGQGGLMDDGNGLFYVRARYYDANTGRFLSKDPVKSSAPKLINPYQYALNDPLGFVDVLGSEITLTEFLNPGIDELKKIRQQLESQIKFEERGLRKSRAKDDRTLFNAIFSGDATIFSVAPVAIFASNVLGTEDEQADADAQESINLLRLSLETIVSSINKIEDIDIWDTDEGDIPEPQGDVTYAGLVDLAGNNSRHNFFIDYTSSVDQGSNRQSVKKFTPDFGVRHDPVLADPSEGSSYEERRLLDRAGAIHAFFINQAINGF